MSHAKILNNALSTPDVAWAFFHMLCTEDRDAMDRLLTDSGHPLAFEAGTQESRFRDLHSAKYRFPEEAGR